MRAIRRRGITFSMLMAAVMAVSGPAVGQAPDADPGRGTAMTTVTALRVVLDDVGDVGVVVTEGRATLDRARAGAAQDGATAQVATVSARMSDGTELVFPDPPMRSEASRGRDVESEGDTVLVVPSPGGPVDPGTVAAGEVLPAWVEAWREDTETGTLATSQVAHMEVLGGLSRLEGVGPGEHTSWSNGGEAGAGARALSLRSATLIEIGPLLHRLGVDLTSLPVASVSALASALGLDDDVESIGLGGEVPSDPSDAERRALVELVAGAPLLAVTDVSGSAEAVAAVMPDGEVRTAAHTAGSVGSVVVGGTELGGFDAAGTATDWNALEAAVNEAVDRVLTSLGPEYHDLARVRVMPVLTERTRLEDGYAVSRARIRLLDVEVDVPPPSAPAGAGPDVGPILDELPGGGAGPVAGVGLGRADPGEAIRVELGSMAAESEHTRPGVTPWCDPACLDGSSDNRSWDEAHGFDASGRNVSGQDQLPRTGGSLRLALFGTAAVLGGISLRTALRRFEARPIGGHERSPS